MKIILMPICVFMLLALLLAASAPRRDEGPPVTADNAVNFGRLLADLVYAYERPTEQDEQTIRADLRAIFAVNRKDYRLAKSIERNWQSVFLDPDYPLYLYQGDPMAPELAESGIPDSPGHAIVVLGYELSNGQMQPELIGRCEAAAAAARAFPHTIIVCSGGATGANNFAHNTEAGLIKAYLTEQCGIEESRIFTDERAMNTADNAVNTFRILQEQGVKSMTIVTSSYHQRWGQAVYHAMAELYRRQQGYTIRSIANYCYDVEPTVAVYRSGDRFAATQIAEILQLPREATVQIPAPVPYVQQTAAPAAEPEPAPAAEPEEAPAAEADDPAPPEEPETGSAPADD